MFMDATKKITALFDCDGVIVDTEGQYTVFWNEMGQKYVNDANFGSKVKGQTLVQIYDKYFAGEPEKQRDITEALNRFRLRGLEKVKTEFTLVAIAHNLRKLAKKNSFLLFLTYFWRITFPKEIIEKTKDVLKIKMDNKRAA